jgi:hypothetical protein
MVMFVYMQNKRNTTIDTLFARGEQEVIRRIQPSTEIGGIGAFNCVTRFATIVILLLLLLPLLHILPPASSRVQAHGRRDRVHLRNWKAGTVRGLRKPVGENSTSRNLQRIRK